MRIGILLILSWIPLLAASQTEAQRAYIDHYKDIAIQEMERAGIPASIKLAQALLESNAGQSELAQHANNHFGIKCGPDWDGKDYYRKDDDYDENGKLIKSCFRSYRRPEDSFIAHSEFLRDPKKEWRYGFLFHLDPLDYKNWASGLKKAGYATSATYDSKLIAIIERYQLFQYDRPPVVDPFVNVVENTYEDMLIGIFQVNDIDVVIAAEGDTPASIAERTGRDVFKVLQYNEMLTKPNTPLKKGDRVFLEPKRNSYRGDRKIHYVKAEETMYDIAQLYGVKLEKLYKKNRLPANSQPAEGERILLRGRVKKEEDRPKLVSEVINKTPYPDVIDIDDFAWPPEEDPFGEVIEKPVPEKTPPPPPPIIPPKPVDIAPVNELPVEPPPMVTPPAPDMNEPAMVFHTVQAGDTLYSLSKRYNTTVEAIRQLNGLTGNLITIGQQLRIK
ncbi:MAG: LysM peptidoglycan-binding domain-containing protein [Saprospirales bacterium]|nr:LysM peptidoglycan-binding domain-containing protein [Saprospirales bacterium]MBK8491676.1 LysM peptidoglycan-binding domain-containing protein [Saprospirales bacterium]